MTVLYVFPHPDDESFGVAHAMAAQLRTGHAVHLLTLTRGGATRRRHDYGYSVDEMGAVRHREMQDVARTIGLTGMTVLDFPDSGLVECDPRELEQAVEDAIRRIEPDVVVTYPVHGISGFHDHIVTHAVVKRVFVSLREETGFPRRLAFFTLTEDEAARMTHFPLHGSPPESIDCEYTVTDDDLAVALRALDCYVTFEKTIEATGIREFLSTTVRFECYRELFDPPLADLFGRLP